MPVNNSDRVILYGLAAFIAWQVYRCCHPEQGAGGTAPLSGQQTTPEWIQQLSQYQSGTDYFTPQGGIFGRCQ